ncbi:hypothetical protein ACFPA8_14520 [Streptomyces ovatisporus]|uniref:Uncharacterized protein n=1 Tax=Streptomyces ovatisporus TaxID=1128682 RepID=A0ABV9A794_9ACTN
MSAQQTTARHDRDRSTTITSSHDAARTSNTQIVVRNNDDGSRTVSTQHGTSTFDAPPPPPPQAPPEGAGDPAPPPAQAPPEGAGDPAPPPAQAPPEGAGDPAPPPAQAPPENAGDPAPPPPAPVEEPERHAADGLPADEYTLEDLHEDIKEINGALLPKTPSQVGLPLKGAEFATNPRLNEGLGEAISEEGATPGYPGSFPTG